MDKKWQIAGKILSAKSETTVEEILTMLCKNKGLTTKKQMNDFLHPTEPFLLSPEDADIEPKSLKKAILRIRKAIENKESIVVYADYDADGITSCAVMWETIHKLGGTVMPYIPHRVEEGYGLSRKGIDMVIHDHHPSLLITVDHGITGREFVSYAKSKGIDVIVTDHHVKPEKLPDCTIVHTTTLCGAGISWFVAKELQKTYNPEPFGHAWGKPAAHISELLSLACIGTIADMVPLVGPNRSIAKYGLLEIRKTVRVGLRALILDAGLTKETISTYDISHVLAPRLNAMGRIVHAMDALRLLCAVREDKAAELARKLSLTNKERQQLTIDTTVHAKDLVKSHGILKKLLFISDISYNPGVIGLVAGKLVDDYYRPAIVVSEGEIVSKASARSIAGFNIVETIRTCSDILVDVGGHPMAAGFTVATKNLAHLRERLEKIADKEIHDDMLIRSFRIDTEISFTSVTEALWKAMRDFEPFGFGNPEPVFVTRGIRIDDARVVGADGKHLKLRVTSPVSLRLRSGQARVMIDAIAFGMGSIYPKLRPETEIDIAYSVDMNFWNGSYKLQLKIKDIHIV
jgi:single-stranded-DNA-specific exonuclease